VGVDADGDGFVNELTRADVTAASIFQATLPVPGGVISRDPAVRAAVVNGERKFQAIGCANCHIPALPLTHAGWVYTEPNPYNPPVNLQVGDAATLSVDLTDPHLPQPRLKVVGGVVNVPAYTDFKLHDITSGPGDPNREPLDMNQPAGHAGLLCGQLQVHHAEIVGNRQPTPFRTSRPVHHNARSRAGACGRGPGIEPRVPRPPQVRSGFRD
jgi:hypothetical protein